MPSMSLSIFCFRQHVVQWRRILPQLYGWKPAPGLGTVATVYNRTNLVKIVSYLRTSPYSGPLDLQISKYRREIGLAGFLLEPNLVRHIGSQSSRYQVRTGDTREFQVNYAIWTLTSSSSRLLPNPGVSTTLEILNISFVFGLSPSASPWRTDHDPAICLCGHKHPS